MKPVSECKFTMQDGMIAGPPRPMLTTNSTYVDYVNDQKRYPKKSASSMKPLFDSLIKKD